jgi:phage head maturation protease
MHKKYEKNIYVPFTKKDDDTRMVYGYCTSESLDSQGEVILREAIIKAWDKYMEYANVREMHQPSAVGITKEYTHDENGTWIGVKVVDDKAWKFVMEGVYKGFSIGGRVVKQKKNIIEEIILSEISLVDRPANPDAKFSISKVDDGLVDQLQLEANKFIMKKNFIDFEGVKYHEDPEAPGTPLLVSGEKVPWTDEDQKELDEANAGGEHVETEEEKTARLATEEQAKKDANVAAGLNEDGTPKEKAPEGGEGAGEGGGADAGVGDGEGEKGEKAARTEWMKKAQGAGLLNKDSNGVLLLAELLSHFEFVADCFGDDAEDVQMLMAIKTAIMTALKSEADEPEIGLAEKTKGLQKMFGSELSKAVAPLVEKMGSFEKSLTNLEKEIEAIKDMRVSPRPKGAQPVEKVIQNGTEKSSKTYTEKKKAVEDIEKEIDEFARTEGARVKADSSLAPSFMQKSAELHGKLSAAKLELSEAGE